MIEALILVAVAAVYYFIIYAILTGGNLRWALDEIEDWWEARKL